MPLTLQAAYQSPVAVGLNILWATLEDRIYRPERFVPNIRESIILEKGPSRVLRKTATSLMSLTELIIIEKDKWAIHFHLQNHNRFSGSLTNRILPPTAGQEWPILQFAAEWQDLQHELYYDQEDLSPSGKKGKAEGTSGFNLSLDRLFSGAANDNGLGEAALRQEIARMQKSLEVAVLRTKRIAEASLVD